MYTDSDRLREGVVIVVAGVAVMSYRKINIGSCQVMSGRQEIVSSPCRAQCSMGRSVELGMVPDIQRCIYICTVRSVRCIDWRWCWVAVVLHGSLTPAVGRIQGKIRRFPGRSDSIGGRISYTLLRYSIFSSLAVGH